MGIELTGDGGDRRLLYQVEAASDLARQDDGVRLGQPTQSGRRRVAGRPHRDRTTRRFAGSPNVAHHQPL